MFFYRPMFLAVCFQFIVSHFENSFLAPKCGSVFPIIIKWLYFLYLPEKRCGEPDEPLNGTVSCLNPHYEYQSICSIHCNTGFILEGSVFMQCQADQTWSVAEQPRCIGNYYRGCVVRRMQSSSITIEPTFAPPQISKR